MTVSRDDENLSSHQNLPGGRFEAQRLAVFYALLFGIIGINIPFWPVWMESRGLNASQIGIALSLGLATKIITNPIIGHFADHTGRRRGLMIFLATGALFAYASFWFGHNFLALTLVTIVYFSFWSPLLPLIEGLTMLGAQKKRYGYGSIRLWGSIGFVVASSVAGLIVAGRSPDVIYLMVVVMLVMLVLAGFALPEIRLADRTMTRSEPNKLKVLIVLSDRKFVIFLIAAALILASHSAFYGFATLLWRSLGYSETMIGLFWAEGTIAEVLLFMFAHRLMRITGALGLMFLGAVAGIIRWSVMAYATSAVDIAAIQLLHGLTFGASHLGAMYYISSHVADHLSATAQGLYSSTVMGLALSGATLVSGYLFDAHGGLVFLAMAGMSMVGLLVLILLTMTQGKQ